MMAQKAEEKAGKIHDIRTMFQPTLPKPHTTQNEFEVLCLRAMVASNWPFSQFEVPEFQSLLNGGYDLHVPSAKVIKARLAKYADEAREEIKVRLTNNESRISLALDCWTSPNRLEFMGICPQSLVVRILIVAITSHYVDNNFVLQEDLLDFSEVDMRHSGINLADHIHKVLIQYEICRKLFCITTDNASNNDTTCEELSDLLYDSHQINWDPKEHHIACLAHVINLAVQSFLKNIKVTQMTEAERFILPSAAPAQLSVVPARSSKQGRRSVVANLGKAIEAEPINDFGSTIKKLRKISVAINFPRSRTRDFWMFCKAKDLKQMKAVHDNDTRWNGTCCMIERAIYLQEAIKPWVQSRSELKEFALSDREWELAEFLLRFLEPFRHATNSIQATGRPTLHQTFVTYEKLFNNLENVKAIFERMEAIPEWFEEVQNAINSMWAKLNEHYTKTKNPSAYVDANILHPAKKMSLFKKKDSSFGDVPGQAEIYKSQARMRFETIYNTPMTKSVDESNS